MGKRETKVVLKSPIYGGQRRVQEKRSEGLRELYLNERVSQNLFLDESEDESLEPTLGVYIF